MTKTIHSVKKLMLFVMLKQIVTFYYDIIFNNSNLLKKNENVPMNTSEHKNCLALLKAAVNTNINFIY